MKLSTDIKPRKSGTLSVKVHDGAEYQFVADESGALVADVTNEEHVGFLLDTGNFYPVDEEDISQGLKLVAGDEAADSGESNDDGASDPEPEPAAQEAPAVEPEPAAKVAQPGTKKKK